MYDEGTSKCDGDNRTVTLQLIGFTGLQIQTQAAERVLGCFEGLSVVSRVL